MAEIKTTSRWVILGAIMVGSILGPLMGSIVNIALPAIATDFAIDLSEASWINLSFILILGSLLLTFSRLGDMYGHRPIFLIGQIIFIVGTTLCGLASSFWLLIIARLIQALGSSMAAAVGGAIIISNFPARERGRALGTFGITIALGLILGPAMGGLIIQFLTWHWIFFASIPLGIFALIYAYYVLPREQRGEKQAFDIPGALLLMVGIGALMLGLTNGNEWGWTSSITLGLGAVSMITLVLFIIRERRYHSPMIPLRMFRNLTFTAGNVAALTMFITEFTAILLLPFFLLNVQQRQPQEAGLILASSPLISMIVAPLAGWASDKVGTRFLGSIGMISVAVSMVLLTRLTVFSDSWELIGYMLVFGFGTSIFQSPNSSAVMGCVERSFLGVGNGILGTTRNMGMAMGIALSTLLANIGSRAYLDQTGAQMNTNEAFLAGMRLAFWVAAIVALLGSVSALMHRKSDAIEQ